ncbi:MAG: CoA-binding protein [Deltaproteobacteria bacterium]|nr:CoA-binding protein [Deltaproteobacteria bacterium]
MDSAERQKLDRMFNPRGMAIFGSVGREGSFANRMMITQKAFGYEGRLYPVSPKGGEVAGQKVYRNIREIEGPVDLASVAVPARVVPEVLRDCLEFGVPGVEIQTSGFAETGEREGIELQKEIVKIANKGLRLIGPNCFGIHSPRGGITLLPGAELTREPGPVAMLSQSGGGALNFCHEAQSAGLRLSKVISFGNASDLNAADLIRYLADDPETEYLAAYIEGVSDGRKFLDSLKYFTQKKPAVIWKAGLTPLGSRATKSHTASMGGEEKIWKAVLEQCGAIAVLGLDELIDTLMALKYLKNKGRKIALSGGGGAIGVFSSDLAHEYGLEIPVFSRETQERLKSRFPTPGNSVLNPLDTGGPGLPLALLGPMIEDIMTREPIDVLVVIMLLHSVVRSMQASDQEETASSQYLEELLEIVNDLKKRTGKDVVLTFENRVTWSDNVEVEAVSRRMRHKYQAENIPVFPSIERALRGISNAWKVNFTSNTD